MNLAGELLAAGEVGEVVICGDNVTMVYENNDKANSEAFSHGWFRTGGQGVLSEHGYLTLTGRLKEIINRGGEKSSPLEVDEVLMDHPAVMQVVPLPCRIRSSVKMSRLRSCYVKGRHSPSVS